MENQNLVFLPNEIINKILMYRASHPIGNILKEEIEYYIYYNSLLHDDDKKTFYRYCRLKFYIDKIKRRNLKKLNK